MHYLRTKVLLLFILLGSLQLGYGQLDSLKHIVFTTKIQKEKWEALNKLITELPWETPDSTIKYCKLFLEEPTISENQAYLANIEYYLGRANRSKGNFPVGVEHFTKSKDIYETLSDSINIAKATYQVGILNLFMGNMEPSLRHLTYSLDLYHKVGTQNDIADLYNALASYYSNNKQPELAILKYNEALKIYGESENLDGMANANANLGMCYVDQENYELAEKHLLEQGRLDTLLETNWGLGFHYDYMGYMYQSKKDLNTALDWYKKALKIRKGEKSHYNICESNLSIASVYSELGNYNKAIPYLKEVLSYKEEHQSLSQLERAFQTLSDCYEAMGNYKSALVNHKELKITSDSIYQKDKLSELANMETAIKKAELDTEIKLLNKENQIAQISLSQQKKLVTASMFSSTIFLAFGLLLFLLYRKIKAQKLEIETALKEKDILLREIHHRVKNNLQIISSVLSLQSRQSKDSGIQQAINEGRNRVRSMALIHQNLYQKENLTGVSVNRYLEKLVEELFHTYNISKDLIQLNMQIDNIDLDVDTMIPLGLIINELVSNSLKHAFTGIEDGFISITLREENNNLILHVQDNGIGVTEKEMSQSNSFGNRLIKAFSQKLKADYKIEKDDGTKITMVISKYLKAA